MITPLPCEKGHYCPTENCTSMIECRKGTFNNEEGATKCKTCTNNHICPENGMVHPLQCPILMERKTSEKECHYGDAFYVVLSIGALQIVVISAIAIFVIRRRKKIHDEKEPKLIPTPKGPTYQGL